MSQHFIVHYLWRIFLVLSDYTPGNGKVSSWRGTFFIRDGFICPGIWNWTNDFLTPKRVCLGNLLTFAVFGRYTYIFFRIPSLGRTPIYVITLAIFVALQVPTALVENFAGLLVLRFLAGFFGSPILATGAATIQDMYPMIKLPYMISTWAAAVTIGPAVTPIIAGFSIGSEGWHWFAWEILWLSGPICLLMFISLPETSAPNILLRRARRLRKITGKVTLKSQSEIDQSHLSAREVAFDALIKPWEINALDPAVVSKFIEMQCRLLISA
jgi:MFS family permease